MVGDDLFDYAKTVASREDFVKFVAYLNGDYQKNRNEWENQTLEQFLAGLSGFANDMAGYYKNMGETGLSTSHGAWQLRCCLRRLYIAADAPAG